VSDHHNVKDCGDPRLGPARGQRPGAAELNVHACYFFRSAVQLVTRVSGWLAV